MNEDSCTCNFCLNGVRDGLGHDDGPPEVMCRECGLDIRSTVSTRDGCNYGEPGLTLAWCPLSRGGCGAWRPVLSDRFPEHAPHLVMA